MFDNDNVSVLFHYNQSQQTEENNQPIRINGSQLNPSKWIKMYKFMYHMTFLP